ncbi:MAG: glycine--tRNA ligase [Flavobacteriales bacterium]|jgi:glycyl-tRNA synthetase|uniref:glycine--tRNA ligase n=1 Tax=Blattabacterium sp. (Mastotermes darwiniensis) TaxID=39768 RepID=UPI000231DF16|nr:glycine--tRNA ligase [Blattabacterium sp. (Mastotermes darwiniensis)]AER40842.1 glycyl-tRNA synthetase [Blattabacterium sp. (Mastotermes darwiniensis) str. MADAR]MDR1804689.1 glycine--tRNA ligase [Flavobacteriales bacterium]
MKKNNHFFHFLISHAKNYGFVFPSSEIYGGVHAIYDYGQYGIELKNNIKEYWWKSMTQLHENIVGLDTSILMHSNIWKASGHIEKFNDFFIDNKDSKKRYRPEVLIREYIDFMHKKKSSIPNREQILLRMYKSLKKKDLLDIRILIDELNIPDPISGSHNWTDIRLFNTMFKIIIENGKGDFFLRPETAQGTFSNFSHVKSSSRMKIPFGIAQIGKSFRNEIISRQFIFRMREFEQMEMQFFILPEEEIKWYEYWKNIRFKWHLELNLGNKKYQIRDHDQLAHYASAGSDIEFNFPFGFREIEGIHSRRDFDLKRHEFFSKKKLRVFGKELGNYIPYVIETSLGLDRLFLAIFSSSLKKEKLKNGNQRIVLKIPPYLSPIKAAIFPLVSKDGLPKIAKKIFNDLKIDYRLIYDQKESIGKLYRRQDAIGTPLCFTIDYETINNNTVTMRYRDSMLQKRVHIKDISKIIERETGIRKVLKKLL